MTQLVDHKVVVVELERFLVTFEGCVTLHAVALQLDVEAAGDIVARAFFQVKLFHDEAVFALTNKLPDERPAIGLGCEAFRPDANGKRMIDRKICLCHVIGSFDNVEVSYLPLGNARAWRWLFYVQSNEDAFQAAPTFSRYPPIIFLT